KGKLVAAICAAPSVLGEAGLLNGKKATCNPGWEEHLKGAVCVTDNAVTDGNIITSRGMGTAMDFSLAILEYFDVDTSKIRKGTVWK
ncbi:MAG: DJ-1/PfpI family protein, partial [Lachnospiraceae bacterium]|nr:DJ-1/PfpI family protein [Lachnospiraceae bacterium]